MKQATNFGFLEAHDPILVKYAELAEDYVFEDPNASMFKSRQFVELLADMTAAHVGVRLDDNASLLDTLRVLGRRDVFDRRIRELFHLVRKTGNEAAHEHLDDVSEAMRALRASRALAVWFHRAFGNDPRFRAGEFVPPERAPRPVEGAHDDPHTAAWLGDRDAARQAILARRSANGHGARAKAAADAFDLDEYEVRLIVDTKLRDAGWEADSARIRFDAGFQPDAKRNVAVADWPADGTTFDYVLFAGETAVAAVEAHRTADDVEALLRAVAPSARSLRSWADPQTTFAAPTVLATNGQNYLRAGDGVGGLVAKDTTGDAPCRHLSAWPPPATTAPRTDV